MKIFLNIVQISTPSCPEWSVSFGLLKKMSDTFEIITYRKIWTDHVKKMATIYAQGYRGFDCYSNRQSVRPRGLWK
jgi:hypothetical protein